MKATGVVRRIDDLGRIVIPKEIRRNFKINEGDSVEIYVDNNGIIIRKYSLLDDMLELANMLTSMVVNFFNKEIIITDRDKVISCSKNMKEYLKCELSSTLRSKINERIEFVSTEKILISNKINLVSSCFLVPILVDSDSLGSIILISDDINEEDKNLVRFIVSILAKSVE